MPRRKKTIAVHLPSGDTYAGHTDQHVCTRRYLEDKYDEALSQTRPTTLYAEKTIYHVERIQRLFEEYCDVLDLDPRTTLQECATARMENFLHWLLQTYTIQKTSTLTTYWRQLSQLYIMWTRSRMEPAVMRQIFVAGEDRVRAIFIEGALTEEFGLNNVEIEKPLLEADDFVELIRYHWASDINVFPNERQRLQLAALLLLAAFTGSRPEALLSLTYRDLDLYVERGTDASTDALRLGVKLTKTKSRQKRKRPKTYTFNLDDNPMFCVITHIVSIAFDDEAFGAPGLTDPAILFQLRARHDKGCQPISWKEDMLDVPIFRRACATKDGIQTSPDKSLPYNIFQGSIKRLGEALGYVQTLTSYCLRRALGNAINDDPNSNAAVRNLALDHVGSSTIFERNYLSRMLRYSTQDAYWNRDSDSQAAKSASRIGRLRDPDRPRRLTKEQGVEVRDHPSVRQLIQTRDRVREQIVQDFGELKMAVGEEIYSQHQNLNRLLNSTVRAEERALLKRVQEEYDKRAPVEAIQRQINPPSVVQCESNVGIEVEIRIPERRRLAEAALSDPGRFAGRKSLVRHVKCAANMIALCRSRERPRERNVATSEPSRAMSIRTSAVEIQSSLSKRLERQPVICQEHQCLFCLLSDLPQEDREKSYAGKFSLRRHVDRCRLNHYEEQESILCPDEFSCGRQVFRGKSHFKNHAARVHAFIL
ncbi:hypothetical protein H2200_008122 [Cladophialophora chaetospira]|uniref:C2H2-type domain-containing protein n=1 Tax=Cladophialophora chaetospira TaxID=386627 RepID=A0AA38X568_9EURO|nr:hypothetical protein H2200_008122 [Cladophialophora chaetospira]